MGKTDINWADRTINPIKARNRTTGRVGHFCVKVNRACQNCYAEAYQARLGNGARYAAQDLKDLELFIDHKALTEPLRVTKPSIFFVCSMTDLFLDRHETSWIDQVFAMMAMARHHKFMVLTKRPQIAYQYFLGLTIDRLARLDAACRTVKAGPSLIDVEMLRNEWPLRNVAIGVTVNDQVSADQFLSIIHGVPAHRRFISYEPATGPIHIARYLPFVSDLVIAGGESGRGAEPCNPDWIRSIRDQCDATDTPFNFKQWGEFRFDPISDAYVRLGKSASGRSIDGVRYDGVIDWG